LGGGGGIWLPREASTPGGTSVGPPLTSSSAPFQLGLVLPLSQQTLPCPEIVRTMGKGAEIGGNSGIDSAPAFAGSRSAAALGGSSGGGDASGAQLASMMQSQSLQAFQVQQQHQHALLQAQTHQAQAAALSQLMQGHDLSGAPLGSQVSQPQAPGTSGATPYQAQ
jgi:hypothetical protein